MKAKPTPMPPTLYRRMLAWCCAPVGAIFLVGLVVLLVSLLAVYHLRPFTSDDVVWQNALLSWRPFKGVVYYGDGSASYLAKVPIYWLIGHLMSPGRRALLASAALFSVANFTLIYWSSLYFLKRLKIGYTWLTLFPFVWLASLGSTMPALFLAVNMHNVEIGAIFAVFAVADMIYTGVWKPFASKRDLAWSIVACLFVGALVLNDQYTLYFCIVPLLLAAVLLWFFQPTVRSRLTRIVTLLVGGGIAYELLKHLVVMSGVRLQTGVQSQFISMEGLGNNLEATIRSLCIIFNADFWGRTVVQIATLTVLVNAALLAVILISIYKLLRCAIAARQAKETPPAVQIFFAGTFVWVLVLYTFSNLSVGASTTRYLIILPFLSVIMLASVAQRLRGMSRRLLTVALVVATIMDLVGTVGSIKHPSLAGGGLTPNRTNTDNFAMIAEISSLGLTKGYTGYWDGNINTYLSKGNTTYLPTLCISGTTRRFDWLIDESQFTKPAAQSFYLYDPTQAAVSFSCSIKDMTAQFGQPERMIHYQNDTILVYGYDITSKI